jgi:hypothetical protein
MLVYNLSFWGFPNKKLLGRNPPKKDKAWPQYNITILYIYYINRCVGGQRCITVHSLFRPVWIEFWDVTSTIYFPVMYTNPVSV